MDPEFTDWKFELEYDPESREEGPWWAFLPVCGSGAVGHGKTPWMAIAACMKDIGRVIDWCRSMSKLFEKLQAGDLSCPQCGTALKPLSDDNPMAGFYCDLYPKCGEKTTSIMG